MGEPWLFGEEKNFLSLLIIEPWFLAYPTCSQSLCWLLSWLCL